MRWCAMSRDVTGAVNIGRGPFYDCDRLSCCERRRAGWGTTAEFKWCRDVTSSTYNVFARRYLNIEEFTFTDGVRSDNDTSLILYDDCSRQGRRCVRSAGSGRAAAKPHNASNDFGSTVTRR